jgi:NIPSNAP
MIHELRTYTLRPNKVADFLKLTGEVGYAIRTRHSKCAGYWTTEVGDLNQVVHLWEYDDFAHRTAVRTALAKDPDWTTKYLPHARECHRRQEATVLIPSDVWPFTPGEGNGVYELRYYRLHPGKVGEWLALFGKGLPARAKYSAPVGVWSSELGRLNTVYHLWGYADLQARAEVRKRVTADAAWAETVKGLTPLMQEMHAKILLPTDFSPMR